MIRRIAPPTIVAALLALALAPLAAAHASATVVEVTEERCYLYTNDGANEFWIESNGYLGPGVNRGSPAAHVLGDDGVPSGLQRGASTVEGRTIPADTQLAPDAWLRLCVLGL